MLLEETNEEVSDESQDNEVEKTDVETKDSQDTEQEDDKSSKEDDKSSKDTKTDDAKEQNRKGYEIRQKVKGVSREEFEKVQESVSKITEENTDLKFRQIHPEVTDETFNSLKALSKGSGKGYEDSLKDPAIQALLSVSKSKERVDNATADPATRTSQPNNNDYANMPLADIAKKADEVRGRL